MSIRVQCGQCQKRFAAPEEAAGKRLKCPQCAQPIVVPKLPVAPAAAPVAERSGPLDDLLEGLALPQPPPLAPAPQLTMQLRPKRRLQFDLGSLLGSWKLVTAVVAWSFFLMMCDIAMWRNVTIGLAALVGLGLAAGQWKTQLVAETSAGENWQWLELWIGRVVFALPVALSIGTFFIHSYYLYTDYVVKRGWTQEFMLYYLGVFAGACGWCIVCVALGHVSGRFGFFQTASWIYLSLFGVLPVSLTFLSFIAYEGTPTERSTAIFDKVFGPKGVFATRSGPGANDAPARSNPAFARSGNNPPMPSSQSPPARTATGALELRSHAFTGWVTVSSSNRPIPADMELRPGTRVQLEWVRVWYDAEIDRALPFDSYIVKVRTDNQSQPRMARNRNQLQLPN